MTQPLPIARFGSNDEAVEGVVHRMCFLVVYSSIRGYWTSIAACVEQRQDACPWFVSVDDPRQAMNGWLAMLSNHGASLDKRR